MLSGSKLEGIALEKNPDKPPDLKFKEGVVLAQKERLSKVLKGLNIELLESIVSVGANSKLFEDRELPSPSGFLVQMSVEMLDMIRKCEQLIGKKTFSVEVKKLETKIQKINNSLKNISIEFYNSKS